MASQRAMYSYDNNSSYSHGYPPPPSRPDVDFDDDKRPYEFDIIASYSNPDVSNAQRTHYIDTTQAARPTYPPIMQKPSFQSSRTGPSEIESTTFDGGGMGSEHALTVGTEKVEKPSFWASIVPDSWACRLYVLTVLLETIIDVGVEAELLARVRAINDGNGDLSTTRLPIYLSIFAFAHLYQFALALDAIRERNTLQFIFLTIFNALFLLYAVVQIFEVRQSLPSTDANGGVTDVPVHVLTTIIPIVVSVAEIAYIALGWQIWREFGWKVYKQLGADRQIKRMYAHYQIFVGIMKFDVFFFIAFSVQILGLILQKNNWEFYVTCAALPLSFLLLLDGIIAARLESKNMMWSFMLGCFTGMVYFVYKLFRLLQMRASIEDAFKTLVFFDIISIILLIITFIMAVIVMRNFGGGLKGHMAKPKHTAQASMSFGRAIHQRQQSHPLGYNPNRMSID